MPVERSSKLFMLRRTLIILLLSTFCIFSTNAQDALFADFKNYDSLSYSYLINKDWDRVISIGNKALDSKIDYYYLRMRMGIAAYNKKYYPMAASHFRKALKFNFDDKSSQLYLKSIYQNMGEYSMAKRIKLISDERNKKKSPIDDIYVGYGYKFSNNFRKNDNYITDSIGDTLNGSATLIGDKQVIYGGLGINISPTVSYYIGFTNLQLQKRTFFQYTEAPLILDSTSYQTWGYVNHYSVKPKSSRKTFDLLLMQNELYQNIKFQFNNGLSVTGFANLIFINTENAFIKLKDTTITRIDYSITGTGPEYFDYTYTDFDFERRDSAFIDYVAGVQINKDFSFFGINFSGSYASLNGANQFQAGLSTYYYLNKQATFYGFSEITFFGQQSENEETTSRGIFHQRIGGKLLSNLWGESQLIYGNTNNTVSELGSIVNNQVDNMKYKVGLKLKMLIGSHFQLNLLYNYSRYESVFAGYSEIDGNVNIDNYGINYQVHSVLGGIVWKP